MTEKGPFWGDSIALMQLKAALETESSDGFGLLRNIENNSICSLSIIESVPCVSIVWKRYATSTQFRYVHENIIHLLNVRGLSKILGDDTALPTIHAEDQRWVVGNWMPRAIDAGLRLVAHKNPDPYFGKLSVDQIKSAAPADLVIKAFDKIEEAQQWLTAAVLDHRSRW